MEELREGMPVDVFLEESKEFEEIWINSKKPMIRRKSDETDKG